jgi:flagellar biogenesis protein FliO
VTRTLIALIGVCALAWFTLQFLSKRGVGNGLGLGLRKTEAARLRVLGRLALGPRQQLYMVQADSRVFLLGTGETGGLALLAELDPVPAPAPRAESAID